jgi:hypothetical protein
MIESQSRYINGLIKPVLEARKKGRALSLRPKKEKVDAYNAKVQEVLKHSSFNDPNCQSWYKTETGKSANSSLLRTLNLVTVKLTSTHRPHNQQLVRHSRGLPKDAQRRQVRRVRG